MLTTEELRNYVYGEIRMRLGEVTCGSLFFCEGTDNSAEGTYIFNKNGEYHKQYAQDIGSVNFHIPGKGKSGVIL